MAARQSELGSDSVRLAQVCTSVAASKARRRTEEENKTVSAPRRTQGNSLYRWLVCVLSVAALSVAWAAMPGHHGQLPRDLSSGVCAASSSMMHRLSLRGGSSNDAVWAAAVDPGSGKTYYFNVKTKEVAWSLPAGATLRPPKGSAAVTATATTSSTAAQANTGQAAAGQPQLQPPQLQSQAAGAAATPAYAASSGSSSATDKGAAASQDFAVTVHAPQVVAEAAPGFGRKAAEPAATAPDAVAAATRAPAQSSAASPAAATQAAPAAAAAQPQTSSAVHDSASGGGAQGGAARPSLSPNSLWREVNDATTGKVYYYHTITKESVWELPNFEQVDGESSLTKFFSRLKTTAAVTSNVTSSIFSRVGGAATRLAAAAATKSPTPDSPAVVAAQPDMYWDAQRNTWMTRQASGPGDASASAAQAEMGWVWSGSDWVWQLKPVEQNNAQPVQQQVQQPVQQQQPAAAAAGGGGSAEADKMGPWQRHAAPDGQSYWWNSLTGESQWFPPTAQQQMGN